MKLMKALEISSGSKQESDSISGTSMKHTDKQKVIFFNETFLTQGLVRSYLTFASVSTSTLGQS